MKTLFFPSYAKINSCMGQTIHWLGPNDARQPRRYPASWLHGRFDCPATHSQWQGVDGTLNRKSEIEQAGLPEIKGLELEMLRSLAEAWRGKISIF